MPLIHRHRTLRYKKRAEKALRVADGEPSSTLGSTAPLLPQVAPLARAGGGRGEEKGRGECGAAVLTCAPAPAAYLVQAVRAAGRCDAVFRGFSDCLLRLGDNMANYPQDLDDKRNLQTICA